MGELRYDSKVLIPPTSWEELVKLKNFLTTYGGETRMKEDQVRYDQYLEKTPREKVLSDIIHNLEDKDPILIKNNYPYSNVLQYLPNVKHYLVWSRKGQVEDSKIQELVESDFPEKEWFSFVTAPNHKSIPEIWHAHVFVNHKGNTST